MLHFSYMYISVTGLLDQIGTHKDVDVGHLYRSCFLHGSSKAASASIW